MDTTIEPLIIELLLESNPLKSRILVGRLAVGPGRFPSGPGVGRLSYVFVCGFPVFEQALP